MAYLDKAGLAYFWGKVKNKIAPYGTCSTAAGTAAKTVACTDFVLATGVEIAVKFTVTNTAANPTLNVNGTGAKAIYYRGAAISAGYLAANRTYTFRYNGTQYDLVGDINTTYSAATSSRAGLMSAADKSKLDSFGDAGGYALLTDLLWHELGNTSGSNNVDIPTDVWAVAHEFVIEWRLGTSGPWNSMSVPKHTIRARYADSYYYSADYFANVDFGIGLDTVSNTTYVSPTSGWITGKYNGSNLAMNDLHYFVYWR